MEELKEVLKGLWNHYKESCWQVKVKVGICFIPALLLFMLSTVGEYADQFGKKIICWAWRDPRYGKNLWGQKAYCPKEV